VVKGSRVVVLGVVIFSVVVASVVVVVVVVACEALQASGDTSGPH